MINQRFGYVDVDLQSHIAGWGVENEQPAHLRILVNNVEVAQIKCGIDRPDLINYPGARGFSFHYPKPLTAEDDVAIMFQDGTHLQGSPPTQHKQRLALLVGDLSRDVPALEFGPLDRPILSRDRYNVQYVDHASRQDLIEKYKSTGSTVTVNPIKISEVDYVWDSTSRLLDVVGSTRRFDFAVASHVIEHVADPISWLREVASVMVQGARINLAIPEKTRTFDHLRPVSTLAQLLDAYIRQLSQPSFGQIFDHISQVADLGNNLPLSTLESAYQTALTAQRSGAYIDVHCHVWTVESWRNCWKTIEDMGLLPLHMEHVYEPFPAANEFIVSFRRK